MLERYGAFSLYDSPYGAHDEGRAIDLYPAPALQRGRGRVEHRDSSGAPRAPSPVAGEVVAIERVRAPSKPDAPDHDVVLAIDTGATADGPTYETADGDPAIARILHVDPALDGGTAQETDEPLAVGDRVAVGDDLGGLVRSGFFAPWVDPHLHLEFRAPGTDLLRASNALPLEVDVDVRAVEWDGTGTVREVGETYAILDAPAHPAPGEAFAALAGRCSVQTTPRGAATSEQLVPIDGGLPHYAVGGAIDALGTAPVRSTVSLLGTPVGTIGDDAASTHSPITWSEPTVLANGEPIHGLSLAAHRDDLDVKLVCPDAAFSVGEAVVVEIAP